MERMNFEQIESQPPIQYAEQQREILKILVEAGQFIRHDEVYERMDPQVRWAILMDYYRDDLGPLDSDNKDWYLKPFEDMRRNRLIRLRPQGYLVNDSGKRVHARQSHDQFLDEQTRQREPAFSYGHPDIL